MKRRKGTKDLHDIYSRNNKETLHSAPGNGNMSSPDEWSSLPGGAKKSQRNLGLLVASGDLILVASSIGLKE